MKTTLNPFENAKRTAQGTGGVSPSVIEEIQAEITVLGSQNETQAQDISDIKAQLTELAGAYSTTEHKTSRKWLDGKDIYERTIALNLTSISDNSFSVNVDYSAIDTLLDSILEYKTATTSGKMITSAWINSTAETFNIKTNTRADSVTESYLTIQYTKIGA